MAVRLLLLFPLLVFCSTQVIPGYEKHWWTQPLDNFGFRVYRPSFYSPQVTSEDSNRFTLKKFRPTKRFDEAQIIEALAPDDETRSEEEAERLRQLLAEDFKLQTRLKRTEMEQLSGAGKEYITRLGKRSWTFHHWTGGWHPMKSWALSTNPVAGHQMLLNTKGVGKRLSRLRILKKIKKCYRS